MPAGACAERSRSKRASSLKKVIPERSPGRQFKNGNDNGF